VRERTVIGALLSSWMTCVIPPYPCLSMIQSENRSPPFRIML
jgi:hypothetical protein